MLTGKMSPFVHTSALWITCGQLWISTASLVPENRKLVCDIYGFTTIIITNQHKTYRHPPNTHHTYTSYSPPANSHSHANQPPKQPTKTTKTASQASQPTRTLSIAASTHAFHSTAASHSQHSSSISTPASTASLTVRVVISYLLTSYLIT